MFQLLSQNNIWTNNVKQDHSSRLTGSIWKQTEQHWNNYQHS